jgi:mono/diheme cytochrome c family protein
VKTSRVWMGESPMCDASAWVVWLFACFATVRAVTGEAAAESLVERGDYLVNTIMACGNCHTPKDATGRAIPELALSGGGLGFDTPAFVVTSPNITPHRETGIGSWSDAEIKRAVIEGARPDHGRLPSVPLAPPMFVNFNKALTTRDLDAVVAYLRTVKPVRNEVPGPEYKKQFGRVPYPDAERTYTDDALKDPVTRGAYLTTIGHCMACHSLIINGQLNYTTGFGRGGRPFDQSDVKGFPSTWEGSIAKNITSHPTSGIGAWTDAEIKRAITKGIFRDGRGLKPPMAFAWYADMTDADLSAIVAWLRTVPPLE